MLRRERLSCPLPRGLSLPLDIRPGRGILAVTLNFTWWGNDDRAERYNNLIAAFNEEYPNITINGTFTDFPAYWEKRQTEAAGGGLPDVWQFSDSYCASTPSLATSSILRPSASTSTSTRSPTASAAPASSTAPSTRFARVRGDAGRRPAGPST